MKRAKAKGLRLRPLSLVVLLGLSAASLALSLVVRSIVQDQEASLLQERTALVEDVFQTEFGSVQTIMPILAVATRPRPGSTEAFTSTAQSFVGQGASAIGALEIVGGVVSVVAAVGSGPSTGSTVTGPQAAMAVQAVRAKNLIASVFTGPQGRELGFVIPVGNIVMYADVPVTPVQAAQGAAGRGPFQGIDGVLYASPDVNPAEVVFSTTAHLPLTGPVDRLEMPIGASEWLLVTRGNGPLVGTFAADAPWTLLGAGLLAALLTSILVDTIGRRRRYALRLVDERTLELRRATDEAEAANRSKSDFLSRMSHELRTPLNAVLGFAQLLELDDLPEGQRESVEQIVKGGRHLLALINEVLDISRIDAGTFAMSVEPVLVGDVLGSVITLVRPLADHRHIALAVDQGAGAGTYALADHQRLRQILLNLLSNAIKYNHEGGTVTVSGRPVGDAHFRITVEDTGPGIRAEDLERVFVPFERLGAERTEVEGAGVGLALSRRLAEAMAGTVDVTSNYGEGSRFWVELPLAETPARADAVGPDQPRAVAHHPQAGSRHKILYVEDNPSNLTLVERLLARREDIEIISAMQGAIGLALAEEHRPTLILLDVHLPDMDGVQFLRQLRDHPAIATTPVVIVSADATNRQVDRLLAAGASSYLTKPLDLVALLGVVDAAIRPAAEPAL